METLKDEVTHTAKPLSQGSCNNGHKAQLLFSLSEIYPQCLVRSLCAALPAETLSSMPKDCYCVSAAAAGVNHKRPDGGVNLHISIVVGCICASIKKKKKAAS